MKNLLNWKSLNNFDITKNLIKDDRININDLLKIQNISFITKNNVYFKNFLFQIIKETPNIAIDYEKMEIIFLGFQRNNKIKISNVDQDELENLNKIIQDFILDFKKNKNFDKTNKMLNDNYILDRRYHNLEKEFEINFTLSEIAEEFLKCFNQLENKNKEHLASLYVRKNLKQKKVMSKKFMTKKNSNN